ncbi:unnamed protein product [Cuscuta campestris]|uniref:Uncharacterized protein n=1 Tax=Cuscuta campestris TaxID=132261 RepID=A0A484LME2_9ASTE|nr:unnamed protein product [Cuscuta campestris]
MLAAFVCISFSGLSFTHFNGIWGYGGKTYFFIILGMALPVALLLITLSMVDATLRDILRMNVGVAIVEKCVCIPLAIFLGVVGGQTHLFVAGSIYLFAGGWLCFVYVAEMRYVLGIFNTLITTATVRVSKLDSSDHFLVLVAILADVSISAILYGGRHALHDSREDGISTGLREPLVTGEDV